MNRYTSILAMLLLLTASNLLGQNYYVSAKSLNLRNEAGLTAKIITQLSYCDNVSLLDDSLNPDWIKISIEDTTGFVSKNYIEKGRCEKYKHSYRVGAICNDGSGSSATGRGACSHHGGVQYWRTKEEVDYNIIKE